MRTLYSTILLLILSLVLIFVFYVCVMNPKAVNCDVIVSQIKVEDFAWGKDESVLYSQKYSSIYKNTIDDCDVKTSKVFEGKRLSKPILLCQNSGNTIIASNANKLEIMNLHNKAKKPLKAPKDYSPIFCNSNYIAWRESSQEFSNSIKITDIEGQVVSSIREEPLIYTIIPVDNKTFISYKGSVKNPGIYKNKDLILNSNKFSQWDFSNNTLYYTQPNNEKTLLKTIRGDKKYSQTLNYSVSQEIKVAASGKFLATKTLAGSLILFELKK